MSEGLMGDSGRNRERAKGWSLLISDGESQKQRVPLLPHLRIGRRADNEIVVDDKDVSRRHALIRQNGQGRYELCDLDSVNGTYLNGEKLHTPATLGDHEGRRLEALSRRPRLAVRLARDLPSSLHKCDPSGRLGEPSDKERRSSECLSIVSPKP